MPAAPSGPARASAARSCPTRRPPTVTDAGVANTNVIWHGGKLLALEEAHLPTEIDPKTLETKGYVDYARRIAGPVTAHPKIDPVTGELIFFGYNATGPFSKGMTYGAIGPPASSTGSSASRRPIPAWCTTSSSPRTTCCSRSCRSPAAWTAP